MKCSLLLLAPLLALAAAGCNTAQVTQPAIVDAGPPCPTRAPQITCDAGEATPGACTGNVTVELDDPTTPDASATVPQGFYQLGCHVTFYVQDPESPTCLLPPACTCETPEAGAADDAGPAPGVWSCIPAQ